MPVRIPIRGQKVCGRGVQSELDAWISHPSSLEITALPEDAEECESIASRQVLVPGLRRLSGRARPSGKGSGRRHDCSQLQLSHPPRERSEREHVSNGKGNINTNVKIKININELSTVYYYVKRSKGAQFPSPVKRMGG